MIAKSDLLIIAAASSMLLVAVAKSGPATQSTQARFNAPANVTVQTNPVTATTRGAAAGASSETAVDATTTLLASSDVAEVVVIPGATTRTTGDVITSTASDFKAPDLIQEASFRTHVVERGDVLSRIAVRYKTTVSELQALNDLNGTVIHVGQKLVYPSEQ